MEETVSGEARKDRQSVNSIQRRKVPKSDLIFREELVGGPEKLTLDEERVL